MTSCTAKLSLTDAEDNGEEYVQPEPARPGLKQANFSDSEVDNMQIGEGLVAGGTYRRQVSRKRGQGEKTEKASDLDEAGSLSEDELAETHSSSVSVVTLDSDDGDSDAASVTFIDMEVIEEEQEGGKEAAARTTEEGDRGEWTGGGSAGLSRECLTGAGQGRTCILRGHYYGVHHKSIKPHPSAVISRRKTVLPLILGC